METPAEIRIRPRRRLASAAVLICLAVLALVGCDTTSSRKPAPTATPTDALRAVTLYFDGSGGICGYRATDGMPQMPCFAGPNASADFAVANGVVYTDAAGGVVAASVVDNTIRWRFTFPNREYTVARPQIVGDVLYAGSGSDSNSPRSGHVCALRRADGAARWCYHTGDTVSQFIADGDAVYASSAENVDNLGHGDPYVYALDSATGALRWKFSTTLAPLSTVDGNVVFITSGFGAPGRAQHGDNWLYALDRLTGRLLWSKPTGSVRLGSLIVGGVGNTTLFTVANDGLYALDPRDGSTRLIFTPTQGYGLSGVQLFGETLYAGAWGPKADAPDEAEGMLYALRLDTGAIRWQQSFDGFVGGFVGTGKSIFVLAVLKSLVFPVPGVGVLYSFDAETGAPRWTQPTKQEWPSGLIAAT